MKEFTNTCDKHEGTRIEFDGAECPLCNGAAPKLPPRLRNIQQAGQCGAGLMNVGSALIGICETNAQFGIDTPIGLHPSLQGDARAVAAVQPFIQQFNAGMAMVQASLQVKTESGIVLS